MATPPRTQSSSGRRSTSSLLRDPADFRLSESERIDGAGSWDAIEWTKVDQPLPRPVPRALLEFMLEAEHVIAENDKGFYPKAVLVGPLLWFLLVIVSYALIWEYAQGNL